MVASLGLAACDEEADPPPAPPSSPAKEVRLTFGVWGNDEQVAAYEAMVAPYSSMSPTADVVVKAYDDRDALLEAVRAGGDAAPDVYLSSRQDLATVLDEGLNRPVGELLDERGVEFGDRYSRAALEAFIADRRLQCMPYGLSPLVIFYNKELVDFDRMENRGLDVPGEERARWTFEEFTAAAEFGTRPKRRSKGVYVEPTLEGLAPFILSGGGGLFDDAEDPSSLTLSEDASREALERALVLLRNPLLTLSDRQVARRSPVEWFTQGRVAMIQGHRDLVPMLRQVPGLDFDVMPMPILETAATVGDITGVCISGAATSPGEAADFLVYALSTEAVSLVTRAGYLVPANQEVALSDVFLQPGRQPEHSLVFNTSVRALRLPPLLVDAEALNEAIEPILDELLNVPILDDLGEYTRRIDEASQTVLDPQDEESEEPDEE